MAKRNKIKSARPLLKLEALEQRQLLAGGFTTAQGQEFSNIVHANGNVYDQVLLKTSAITVTSDAGQITRVSFLDLQGDIVQAEFSGAGSLSISLDSFSGPAEATKYSQPGVQYVSGLASFTIQGSDATTNFTLFSVGTATANGGADNPIFAGGTMKGGDATADAARITVVADPSNPNGSTFGGIRAGNAVFSADSGPVGISAANVQIQNVVTVGNVNATGTAIPTLIFGTNSQFGTVTVAGGGLVSANGSSINNTGSYKYGITLAAGTKSDGTVDAAETSGSSLNFTGSNPFAAVNNVFTLTKSVDTIPGMTGAAGTTTNGDDTIDSTLDDNNAGTGTLSNLDTINGGKGVDTLNILDLDGTGGSAQPAGITVSGVEIVNIRAADVTSFNTSTWSDVTNLNVTQATSATITAAKTTAVGIAGVTGAVTENGGSSVTVTTSGSTVTVGGITAPAGAITVTHSKTAENAVSINGGTNVTLSASGRTDTDADATTGTITIGNTTKPSGTISVTSTGVSSDTLTASATQGNVAITGGSTVTVTSVAASATTKAAADTTNYTVTQSYVNVTGGASTTSVTVNQDAAVTAANAVAAVAGTKEVTELTFAAMAANDTIIIDGLTFTASKTLTAAQAAAAFANLAASSVHGSTAASSGVYSGTLSANWSSGAVVTASGTSKVTFTAAAVGNATDIDVDDGTIDPTVSTTAGTAATAAVTGKMGVVGGKVVIADNGDGVLATVSLTGMGAASTINSKGLTALTVANSNEDVTITNTAATTLGLTVNAAGISGNTAVVTDGSGVYTTANVTATGTNSWVDLTGAAIATVAVSGDKTVNLSGSTLAVLKTVTVSGTAGLTLDGDEADTITSINTSATTGAVTATINPGTATYTGGAGADMVTTVTTTTPTKAVSLGAGDDTLTLAAGTTSSTSELAGADGTDTLSMVAADAQTASATATFEAKISGFEKVQLGQVAATTTNTIDLDNLDEISYVVSGGLNAADSVLNIDNMANAGTLSITAAAGASAAVTDVDLKDATGTADSLNVIITNTAGIDAGTVNIAGVETINLTATDTTTTAIGTHMVKLVADKVTSLVVTGNANLTISATSTYAALASLDASAATGVLTATGNGTIAQTIKGGSAADVLTAGYQGDTLIGNGGADTLVVNGKSLVTLTGGDGNDTFDISAATVNVNSYATITALAAGDKIKFSNANKFLAAAISLDPSTAVFQDYANAAINATDAADVAWFQYNGNTYVVENQSNGASFLNGTDRIVKVSGAVDLSAAVLSSSADTLLIV